MRNQHEAYRVLVASLLAYSLSASFAPPIFAQDQANQFQPSVVLPRPEPKFKGRIGITYKDSQPDKIPIIKAPEGAPNVLLILIDDCGFGQWSTFGGQIPTPNLDRLARSGLRYTRFHTTALCSPTRAAILTGRNHHSAGTGVITEVGSGYPGYSGQYSRKLRDGLRGSTPERLQHRVLRQKP
jgi:Sulfatase